MKKKFYFLSRLSTVLFTSLVFTTTVMAADDATVTFDSDSEIVYENYAGESTDGYYLGAAFQGMAPGDSNVQTIQLKNENDRSVVFYVSQDTLQTLEKTNNASGGAYTVNVRVGEEEKTAESLLSTQAGGYKTSQETNTASKEGLAEVTELQDYTYLATLEPGESTNLYLEISLDGEGIDSTSAVNYASSVADIGMNFQVREAESPTENETITQTITNIENVVIPLAATVQTSDEAAIGFYLALLGIGAVLFIGMLYKRKKRKEEA